MLYNNITLYICITPTLVQYQELSFLFSATSNYEINRSICLGIKRGEENERNEARNDTVPVSVIFIPPNFPPVPIHHLVTKREHQNLNK